MSVKRLYEVMNISRRRRISTFIFHIKVSLTVNLTDTAKGSPSQSFLPSNDRKRLFKVLIFFP